MPDVSELRSIAPRRKEGCAPPIGAICLPPEMTLWDLNERINEAADTIESLQSTVSRLREVLEDARETIASFDDGHGLLISEETTITKIDEALKDIDDQTTVAKDPPR